MKKPARPPESRGDYGGHVVAVVVIALAAPFADAAESTSLHGALTSRSDRASSDLIMGLEFPSLKVGTASLTGGGFRFGYDYALNDHWSVNPNLALVFAASKTQGYLYSGFNGILRYSLFGGARPKQEVLLKDNQPIVSQQVGRESRLFLGLGIEQLFLNGAQQVYPAAGPTAVVGYSFNFMKSWFEVSARLDLLSANSRSVTGGALNLSMLIGL